MSSGWTGENRLRLDSGHGSSAAHYLAGPEGSDPQLAASIERTTQYLLRSQHPDGHWVGELEGDTILESEYILLLTYLGRENTDEVRQAANYVRSQQLPSGGWSIYPDGPLEISASVKAYWVLKIAGDSSDAEHMQRARQAILSAGGAERVNSFTRYYFALLGIIHYRQCPAVPPELMLIPNWSPFNIYEMSAWSRTILVPLSILWAYQPSRRLPDSMGISELFLNGPENLPVSMVETETVDDLGNRSRIRWKSFFRRVDLGIKFIEKLRLKPFRKLAVERAHRWILERFEESDGLGAIFPPIIWSVVALKCLGYDEESAEVTTALQELEKLAIVEGDSRRLQPCKSPVWDTALATLSLREAGLAWNHPAIRKSVRWMLSKEVRRPGDWSVRNARQPASGWFFEYENAFYPDVDDTTMVVMALFRCLPHDHRDRPWSTNLLIDEWSPHEADRDAAAIVSTRTNAMQATFRDLEDTSPTLSAIWRGVRWVLSMQNRDGGWGAFDVNNDREIFTQVPFADHNAMIDPSTADITSRVLEMLGTVNVPRQHSAAQQALEFVWNNQEDDGSWIGRWGVNYLYGTWQTIVGLTRIGIPTDDPRIRAASKWLIKTQQENGGWGETPASYDSPELRGQGPTTASQTAWAIMGLIAAGHADSETVRKGISYLLTTQESDGTWDEPEFTGTGFPRVFYLKYHLYSVYFPLMALGRYRVHALRTANSHVH